VVSTLSEPVRIIACIFLPVIAAILVYNRPKSRAVIVLVTTLATAGLVISLSSPSLSGHSTYPIAQASMGLELTLQVDPLTWVFALISSVLWVPAGVYALGYMQGTPHEGRFFAFYLLALSATMGIAFAGSLITLYLFYELLTLVTYPLVVHSGGAKADEAGKNYIAYSLFGAALILLGIVLASSMASSLTFSAGGMLSVGSEQVQLARTLVLVFIFGFGVKAAIIPLHRWLPLAMAAPTPVSALLHAVAVVNAGSYGIIRALYTVFGGSLVAELGMGPILITIACVTIVLGSVWAMREQTLKRRLAFSTISQMGYLMLGGVLLTPLGLQATLIHFVNHALMKIVLFFSVGALNHSLGITQVDEVKGLGKRFPLVFAAFTLSSLGMVGIVPMNGFVSKWYYLQGALQGHFHLVVGVLALSSVLNALYYFPIISKAFFADPSAKVPIHVHHSMKLELPGLAIACCALFLGLFPQWLVSITERASALIG
jgi:multicomponent Na+:H+ antiporter subunit D